MAAGNRIRLLMSLSLALALAGCLQPPAMQRAGADRSVIRRLEGSIQTVDRQVSALVTDVANGATVSLIDGVTGTTVATCVSTPQGAFSLYLPDGFAPTTGRPYHLEAMKGLAAGATANRAGASAARLRTILFAQNGDWVSLNSATPGDRIQLGWATTALAAIASLRGLSANDQLALMGTVNATGLPFTPTVTVGLGEFSSVYALVDQALRSDQDPIEAIGYDPGGNQYGLKPGQVVLFDGTSPATVAPGGSVTVTGQNLPIPRSEVSVTLAGQPVAWTVNATRTQLTATLPASASCGYLQITQGTSTLTGPFIPVSGTVGTFAGSGYAANSDGKGPMASFFGPKGIAVDATGNVYVSEVNGHRIRRITPQGVVTTLAGNGSPGTADGTGTAAQFQQPYRICLDSAGNVLVAEWANKRVRRITPAGVVSTLDTSGNFAQNPATPYVWGGNVAGVAVDPSNNLYVSEYTAHKIWKVSGGSVAVFVGSGASGLTDGTGTGAALSGPDGLLWASDGYLYAANNGANHLKRISASGQTWTLDTSGNFVQNPPSVTTTMVVNVAYDPGTGTLYAPYANRLLRAVPGVGVSNYAGDAGGAAGYVEGSLAAARFSSYPAVARATDGRLYLADESNNVVRVIVP